MMHHSAIHQEQSNKQTNFTGTQIFKNRFKELTEECQEMLILKLNTTLLTWGRNNFKKNIVSQLSYPHNLTTKDFVVLIFRQLTNDSTLVMAEIITEIRWNNFPVKNHFTSKTLNCVSTVFLLQLLKFFLKQPYSSAWLNFCYLQIVGTATTPMYFARALVRQNDLKESPVTDHSPAVSALRFSLLTLLHTMASKFKSHEKAKSLLAFPPPRRSELEEDVIPDIWKWSSPWKTHWLLNFTETVNPQGILTSFLQDSSPLSHCSLSEKVQGICNGQDTNGLDTMVTDF